MSKSRQEWGQDVAEHEGSGVGLGRSKAWIIEGLNGSTS